MNTFDQGCKLIQQIEGKDTELPNWVPQAIRKAPLFVFKGDPADFLPKTMDDDTVDFLRDNMHLPFPEVAISDYTSTVLLRDLTEAAVGCDVRREYCEILDMPKGEELQKKLYLAIDEVGKNISTKALDEGMRRWLRGEADVFSANDMVVIQWGSVFIPEMDSHRVCIDGQAEGSMFFCNGQYKYTFNDENLKGPALQNIKAAMEEVMLINSPDRFIVEVEPANLMRPKGDSIARSNQRPRYTVMRLNELRRTTGLEARGNGKKSPHARRAHFRTLKNDRYTHKRGQRVFVKSTWVGPNSACVNGKTYKVVLDR